MKGFLFSGSHRWHEVVGSKGDSLLASELDEARNMSIRDEAVRPALLPWRLPHRHSSAVNSDHLSHDRGPAKGRNYIACRFHVVFVAILATHRKARCSEFRYRC